MNCLPEKEKLVILGSGPAGLTAAVYAARAGLSPLVIEGDTPGGQLMGTTYVENWPGIESILGPTLMLNMRKHASFFGARFLSQEIIRVEIEQAPFSLITHKQQTIITDALIIATGATPRRLHCIGEDIFWGKGVTTCAVCDGAFYRDMPVVIVGGGDTALENALFMTNFTQDITIVHILEELTASKAMRDRIKAHPSINIIYTSSVSEIKGNNRVEAVVVQNMKTGTQTIIPAQAVFIAIGLTPNTQLFKNKLALTDYGYILTHDTTHTSVPGIFAAGDVADYKYRQAITSAGTGCAAALDAERYLKEQEI